MLSSHRPLILGLIQENLMTLSLTNSLTLETSYAGKPKSPERKSPLWPHQKQTFIKNNLSMYSSLSINTKSETINLGHQEKETFRSNTVECLTSIWNFSSTNWLSRSRPRGCCLNTTSVLYLATSSACSPRHSLITCIKTHSPQLGPLRPPEATSRVCCSAFYSGGMWCAYLHQLFLITSQTGGNDSATQTLFKESPYLVIQPTERTKGSHLTDPSVKQQYKRRSLLQSQRTPRWLTKSLFPPTLPYDV